MVIKLKNITKKFSRKMVLQPISFEFEKGAICVIEGNDGSGKTVLLRILNKELKPSSGKIFPEKHTRAFASDSREAIKNFSLNDYLTIYSLLYPKFNKGEYLTLLKEFKEKINFQKNVSQVSLGKRTLYFNLLALQSRADIILLDEPFQHLDIVSRTKMASLINNLAKEKTSTIFISTHELLEMEHYATHLIILKKGAVLFLDSLKNAKNDFKVISGIENSSKFEIKWPLTNEILVKTTEKIGREPSLRDLSSAFLNASYS